MTAEVSRSAAEVARSGTGIDALVERIVDISEEGITIDCRRARKDPFDVGAVHEPCPMKGNELTHGLIVPRDDEGLPLVNGSEDACAVVTQLSLTDHLAHVVSVAVSATLLRSRSARITPRWQPC